MIIRVMDVNEIDVVYVKPHKALFQRPQGSIVGEIPDRNLPTRVLV
jgi:hypothetical protein